MMRILAAALLSLALPILAGCNAKDAQNLGRDAQSVTRHTGEALGNAKVAASVNTVLTLRKGVDMRGLHIDSQGGTVTVGGHVRNKAEKRRVLDTVNNTRGVEKVIDNLKVEP
jgi:osmotically-inducible protein OsmY